MKGKWDWKKGLVGPARRRKKPFPTLEEIEEEHIAIVLEAYGYNVTHSAKALGINRSTIIRKLAKWRDL